jgi:long-subunit fatty acid transport protein
MMRRLAIILILTAVSLQAAAQAVPFVTIRTDAASLAMGGARVASEELLPISGGVFQAGVGKVLWQTKAINYNITGIEARVRILDNFTAGIDYTSNRMDEMNLFSDNGQPTGTFQPSEMSAALRLSYNVSGRFNLNAAGKMIRSSLSDSHTASAYAADLGAIFIINDNLRAGAAIENLGGKMDYGYGSYPLPTTFKAGLDGAFTLSGKHALLFAADAGLMPCTEAFLASIGTGYEYNKMLSVRCGAHICSKETVLPTCFCAGIFFKSTIFDIGAAWLSAANTYSLSARIKL